MMVTQLLSLFVVVLLSVAAADVVSAVENVSKETEAIVVNSTVTLQDYEVVHLSVAASGKATPVACYEDEFLCKSGDQCISLEFKCDCYQDCEDNSDEEGCANTCSTGLPCDCGPGEETCEIEDDEQICTCKEGYSTLKRPSLCTEECNALKPCQNGGKCNENLCDCLLGTDGDLCETVTLCKLGKCGNNTDCVFDTSKKTAVCICKDPTLVLDWDDRCKKCDCGFHAEKCHFTLGEKRCTCVQGYAVKEGMCEECDCGWHSTRCSFDQDTKFCYCASGYEETNGTCERCDCGDNAKSCFFVSGRKMCNCKEGYDEILGNCTECDCGVHGRNGSCFYFEGVKHCNCTDGYADKLGNCTSCDCGGVSTCFYNLSGKKACVCSEGYKYSIEDNMCKAKVPWFRSPFIIFGLIVFPFVLLFGISLAVYRKLRRDKTPPRQNFDLRSVSR